MRVFFTNLGCKLNQAELERAARQFRAAGHEVVDEIGQADLHVVNTCTVTHVAARTSRKVARRSQRQNPQVRTVLTGCWVAEAPDEAARLAGVDLVVGNHDKENLVARVHERFPDSKPATGEGQDLPYLDVSWGHARAAIKIEDGCNVHCAFCIIPSTRGRQRSRPPEEVVEEVASLVDRGVEEVVLTGVQISHYRSGEYDLYALVCRLLAETDLPRLRLTSVAPWRFDRRLLDLFAGGRLCRHFHLSLQSGCTETLRRMRRPYTAAGYAELTEEIRERVPGVALTTDVIVGFPGETEEEFAASLEFVRRQQFARIHAFPYSARPGTAAAALSDSVTHEVKRQRMERLLAVARTAERSFWLQHVGTEMNILWERCRQSEGERLWEGTSDNYIHVTAPEIAAVASRRLEGRLYPAYLTETTERGVRARWNLTAGPTP